jgi:hypothetical protein
MLKSNSNQYFWSRIAEAECQKKRNLGAKFLLLLLLVTIVAAVFLF